MATVNYLDKTEISSAFSPFNLSSASQQAVINQLISDGLFDNSNPDSGASVWVESDLDNGVVQPPLFGTGGNPQIPGFVQVLEIQGSITPVQTTSALKIIVDDGSNTNQLLNVSGGANPVFIALGDKGVTVNLGDSGNDTVLGGAGNDSITANSGHDLLIGGAGNDTLTDTYGNSTLVAGLGSDTIIGVQGDTFSSDTRDASGNDVFKIFDGGGNSTINLMGADSVQFLTTAGNDTINNGNDTTFAGGADTVDFTGSSTHFMTDIKMITPGVGAEKGDYTIQFSDNQTVVLNAHGASASQNAFVLEFKDGTLNLKGGS